MRPNFTPKNPIKNSRYWKRGEIRQCKYCSQPAKKNLRPNGENKGWYKTCGNVVCLTAQYRDQMVNAKKCWRGTFRCEGCKIETLARGRGQRWCSFCVPNNSARGRMQRYGLSEPQYRQMLLEQNNLCYLCQEKFPGCVDHDHNTNKVRRLLCDGCNTKLSGIDNPDWLERALQYVKAFSQVGEP
jgi:Recombination endonuclease VII